ncbi:MAG TPA: cytochrome c [Balneolaceae bacterium]|nr:cytochrome c [Balneolaceae bacterium]
MRFLKFLIIAAVAIPITFFIWNAKKSGPSPKNKAYNNKKATSHINKYTGQPKISAARGKKIAKNNGCFSCHSTDGSKKTGPTWKNLYGRKTKLKSDSTIIADSSYIAQSIKKPKAKVVKGFMPVMPNFSYLSKAKIKSIIAYIKSISKNKSKSS